MTIGYGKVKRRATSVSAVTRTSRRRTSSISRIALALVRLLQTLRDLLQPAQLGEPRPCHHHPSREREPGLECSRDEAEPRGAGRVHLRSLALDVGGLGVQA